MLVRTASSVARFRYDGRMSFADALDILHEDNHCLALNKPAGWPSTHYDGTEETVDRLAKAYLKEKYGITIPKERIAAYNGYPDVAATQEQARPIIQKLKSAGVTSIIASVDPFGSSRWLSVP